MILKRALIIITCAVFLFVGIFRLSDKVDNGLLQVIRQYDIRRTVVIDAGHGGKDGGTIGIDGSIEKAINLSIALELYDFLMVSAINSDLTRSGDYEMYYSGEERNKSDLYNRLDYINSKSNAVLISIHQNNFQNENEWGTQIWYSENDDKSKIFADKILNSIKQNLQNDNKRENKPSGDDYYLLYKASVPSIMIECGFMSNAEENEKLQDIEYQKKLAFSILCGICEDVQ